MYGKHFDVELLIWFVSNSLTYNGSRLCAGGDLEHKSFKLAQKPIRITDVEFSNSAPLAQNRCYLPFFCR
jgi:hypothetical protein